jgi:hypothetical protein
MNFQFELRFHERLLFPHNMFFFEFAMTFHTNLFTILKLIIIHINNIYHHSLSQGNL